MERIMMRRAFIALALFAAAISGAGANWEAVERVEPYSISGTTGIELYQSIGANGPKIGIGRAIAYTNFDLKWSRDYQPQPDGSCVLVTARPHLIITYALPKPSSSLSPAMQRNWDRFIEGIRAHERVHGEDIKEMVRAIEAYSVGLSAPADPGCQKVRQKLQARLGELSQAQRQKSRDFDRVEMSNGGNIHQLILTLVNG
jgi:predicted secreted Zn-dependent protease